MSKYFDKIMLYIIAGNFVSIVLFSILIKSLQLNSDLSVLESSIGWFLIEHIFEEYNLTTSKFFLINEDFRTLIKNFLMILRNVIFLAQFFNPLEFFIINLLLICMLIFNKKTYFYDIIKLCVFFSYIFLFKSFLFLNFGLIYILCYVFFLVFSCLFTVILYGFIFYWFLILDKDFINQIVRIIIIKISLYLLLNFFMLILVALILILYIKTQENIFHEFVLNTAITYSYVIYQFKNNLS